MDGVNSACQTSFDCYDALLKLWAILAGEADSRWGVDGISLDAIRLEVMSGSCGNQPFAAKTFRAGSNFDEVNALAWAILQLQADVAAKLYELSESIYSPPTPAYTHGDLKELASSRPYHLQVLLFLADRHWNHFHGSLKEEITDTLLQFVSVEDSTVQSWVFLTLAAIAFSEHLSSLLYPIHLLTHSPPMPMFGLQYGVMLFAEFASQTRVVQRATQGISLSYHFTISTARPLLYCPQRFLLDIESLAKDIDVQGPSYPYDSVCSFLSQCLTLASQDVRLYRMHFEDKVLAWLMDNWKGTIVSKDKLALNTIQDVILLLQTGLYAGSIFTPAKTIYVQQSQLSSDANAWPVGEKIAKFETGLPPRGRERKVKAFFSRTLDTILSAWDTGDSSNFHPTAETARATLDMAVVALIFERNLAEMLISIIVPFLKGSRWSWTEKALIALGLEPLVSLDGFHSNSSSQSWTALLSPGRGSGIRSQTLEALLANEARRPSENIDVLKVLWQNPDVGVIMTSCGRLNNWF
ncbi:hypothetical protein BDQ17DRAFT_1423871 [Cyathus striatus]|nr:hypothetical protein BDQ17DRAFT_1423871 [Cyathus striatus]